MEEEKKKIVERIKREIAKERRRIKKELDGGMHLDPPWPMIEMDAMNQGITLDELIERMAEEELATGVCAYGP